MIFFHLSFFNSLILHWFASSHLDLPTVDIHTGIALEDEHEKHGQRYMVFF